jgi:hypothetical protein
MDGPPTESCVEMLARHEREQTAYMALLESRAENELAKASDPGSMDRDPGEELDLESDIREAW